jgi:transposase
MARAYSLDLRERVVGAVAAGQSCRAVAATFGVSVASVVKWSQRFRSTGSAAAFKVGGRRPFALAGERRWLLARIAEEPDLTLRAIAAELAERGIQVSYFAVWHFFEHEGISFKKKACTPASRIGPTSRGGARSGRSIRESLIRPAWSSSTRPGPRPT